MRAESVGQETEITDSDESLRQHMEEEAAQELHSQQGHLTLPAAVGIVLPAESNAFAIERQQTVIGNGDAMRVTAEIAQYFQRSAEGRLGIHDPVLAMQPSQKSMKLFRVRQRRCWSSTTEPGFVIEAFQAGAKLASEHAAQTLHRQKERIAWANPIVVIRRQPARRDSAVNVGMEKQVLPPSV